MTVVLGHRLFALVWVAAKLCASGDIAAISKETRYTMENVTIRDSTLTLRAGSYDAAGKKVAVKKDGVFEIAPAEVCIVENEPLKLSRNRPESWHGGTRLKGPDAWDVNAGGSFLQGSLVIRKSVGGAALVEGKDYLVSPEYGMVGIGPEASVSPDDEVYASYRYGLLRVDSIQVDGRGRASLVRGQPHVSAPEPPTIEEGSVRLLNIFRPYHSTTLRPEDIFPVMETSDMVQTRTTRGRIPRTIAKLKAGKPVMIVCLGDSVTAGGNASRPTMRYVEQFRRAVIDKFPQSPVNVVNISFGGSNSSQWLRVGPMKDFFVTRPEAPADRINFERVVELKPDLVTVEFVNDAGYDRGVLEVLYGEILRRVQESGAELILITPHFTCLKLMGLDSLRAPESRPYVQFLYEFADAHQVAVADASSRWAHLWKEGIPYTTLLHNTINHPDDRGHRLFAEELMKCFEE